MKNARVRDRANGKGGFTLVELSVVLALLAILTTMIVSFSALMNGVAAENQAEYDFLEDCAKLKDELTEWSAEHDTVDSVFSVHADGVLTVTQNSMNKAVAFADGVLLLGDEQIKNLGAIDGMTFSANDKLIKCVTYRYGKGGERKESSFVFAPRCGAVSVEEATENE